MGVGNIEREVWVYIEQCNELAVLLLWGSDSNSSNVIKGITVKLQTLYPFVFINGICIKLLILKVKILK